MVLLEELPVSTTINRAEAQAQRRLALDEADRKLCPGLLRGDQQAWNEFYERYNPRLDRFFSRERVQSQRDREDLFLETMEVIVRRLVTFDPAQGPLRNWVYGVAKIILLRHQSAAAKEGAYSAQNDEMQWAQVDRPGDEPEQPPDARQQQLKEAIQYLSERDQKFLLLRSERSEDEWPWKALAEELGVGESAAKMAYHRALDRLKRLMNAAALY